LYSPGRTGSAGFFGLATESYLEEERSSTSVQGQNGSGQNGTGKTIRTQY